MSNLEGRISQRLNEGDFRSALETIPTSSSHHAHGDIPNTPLVASLISFSLGVIFVLGTMACIPGSINKFWWYTPQLGFFTLAWATFHWGEFAVTAGWNREKCSVDSFLLNNGRMYHAANAFAILEYLIISYYFPSWKSHRYITATGIIFTICGQIIRSAAMIHASTNFSHTVQFTKAESHRLVTGGIYAWFRHPSYAGFFYWSLGTQIALQNTVSFVGFSIILWRFFYFRIRSEESALIKFFGEEYKLYRQRVGTRIPFIP